jgi:hypothetical protein
MAKDVCLELSSDAGPPERRTFIELLLSSLNDGLEKIDGVLSGKT